jgi:hypothetical protein
MIKQGDIIKHKRSMDVCFNVFTVESRMRLLAIRGAWINLGRKKSWLLDVLPDVIMISINDLHDWEICKTPEVKCLRNSEWGPV